MRTRAPVVLAGLALALAVVMLAVTGCSAELREAARLADEAVSAVEQAAEGGGDGDGGGSGAGAVGGVTPAADVLAVRAMLDGLEVAGRESGIKYDRDDWRHWVDDDRDCQNTRAEVLIEESSVAAGFANGERCRVTQGRWVGPWSGEIFTEASEVDIDHHVPLGHAHESGGWDWDEERKREYANDRGLAASLQATKASLNRAKGKQAPDEWRPEDTRGWCRYAADWIAVKQRWELTVTGAERGALAEMLDSCSNGDSWGLGGMAGG